MTTTRKLTTLESRATDACEAIRTWDGAFHFSVIWKRSRTWGNIPSIAYRGEKCATASGCGYDKLSAVLVDLLQFLYPHGSDEWRTVCSCSGAGVSTLRDELAGLGWELCQIYVGQSEDAFTIRRIQEPTLR